MKKNSLGTNAIALTAARIVTTGIGLVSAMLLSRFRSLEEYGTYSQILIVVNLVTAMFSLGLPSSINYFLARADRKEERQQFLSVYFTVNTLIGIIMGCILVALCPVIGEYFNNKSINMFWYVLAVLPWTKVLRDSLSHIMIVYEKVPQLSVFNILSSIIIVSCILIIRWFNLSFSDYMKLYVISESLITISIYVIVWRVENPLYLLIDKRIFDKIIAYSLPIGLSSFVGTLMIEADKLIIGSLLNTEKLAVYTNAAKELPLTMVSSSFTAVLIPQMVKKLKENKAQEAIDLWGITIELSYIIIVFCVTALVVFAPQIMVILYSEKYLPGINVFRVYSVILIIRVTSFGIILNATGNTKYILLNSIFMLVANIALDYILFYIIGFSGPAVATLVTHLLGTYLLLKRSSKIVGIKTSRLIPWKKLFIHTLYNITWGFVVFLIVKFFCIGIKNSDIITCILIGLAVTMIYFTLEMNSIKGLWKKING